MENGVCRICAHCPVRVTPSVRLLKLVSLVSVSLVADPVKTVPANMPASITSVKVKVCSLKQTVFHNYY
jgi:hypothetical protein